LLALSILFEAQCALSELFQSEMEEAECAAEFFSVNIDSKLLH
jgi:hypothetical protein